MLQAEFSQHTDLNIVLKFPYNRYSISTEKSTGFRDKDFPDVFLVHVPGCKGRSSLHIGIGLLHEYY